jgi:hypothetical protein
MQVYTIRVQNNDYMENPLCIISGPTLSIAGGKYGLSPLAHPLQQHAL